jgi:hypothetical protein
MGRKLHKIISNSHRNVVFLYNPRVYEEDTQIHKQMRYGVTANSVKVEWKVHHLKN